MLRRRGVAPLSQNVLSIRAHKPGILPWHRWVSGERVRTMGNKNNNERRTLRGPNAVEPVDGAPTHATQAFPHFMHCPRGWSAKAGIFDLKGTGMQLGGFDMWGEVAKARVQLQPQIGEKNTRAERRLMHHAHGASRCR